MLCSSNATNCGKKVRRVEQKETSARKRGAAKAVVVEEWERAWMFCKLVGPRNPKPCIIAADSWVCSHWRRSGQTRSSRRSPPAPTSPSSPATSPPASTRTTRPPRAAPLSRASAAPDPSCGSAEYGPASTPPSDAQPAGPLRPVSVTQLHPAHALNSFSPSLRRRLGHGLISNQQLA